MQKIVKLRIYRGTEILKNLKGEVKNENQSIKLKYNSKEWHNFLKKMTTNGYGIAKVEGLLEEVETKGYATEFKKGDEKELIEINKEVQLALVSKKKIAYTPEQKEIEKLKAEAESAKREVAEIKELLKDGNTVKKVDSTKVIDPPVVDTPVVIDTPSGNDDMKALRAEYKLAHPEGKNAFPAWKADVLKEKIAAYKAAK